MYLLTEDMLYDVTYGKIVANKISVSLVTVFALNRDFKSTSAVARNMTKPKSNFPIDRTSEI